MWFSLYLLEKLKLDSKFELPQKLSSLKLYLTIGWRLGMATVFEWLDSKFDKCLEFERLYENLDFFQRVFSYDPIKWLSIERITMEYINTEGGKICDNHWCNQKKEVEN